MKLDNLTLHQRFGQMRWQILVDSAVGAGRLHIGNIAPMSGLGEGWWVLPHTLDATSRVNNCTSNSCTS